MHTVKQFSAWFSKQNLIVKLAIGVPSGLILCCLCSIPLVLLSPSTPRPVAGDDARVPTVLIETASTETNQITTVPINTPNPTETPLSTETIEPTAILSTEEALLQLSKNRLDDDLIDAKLSDVFGKKYASVDVDLGMQWDENSAINSANVTFVTFAPKVFEIEGIDVLELRFFTMFTDVYGNEKQDVALKYTITRELSNKINWGGISWRRVGVILNLEGDGSGVYVHPVLEAAWREYISGQ